MDAQRPATIPDLRPLQASEISPSERRRRAHEILSGQRSQLDRFEHELTERLRHLSEELARDMASNQCEQFSSGQQAAEDATIAPLRQQLAAREVELDAARAALDEARTNGKRLEQDTRIHEALLAEAHAEQERRRVAMAACQEQFADVQAQLSAARARQEELRIELADQQERLSAEQEETKAQRRRIARELKARHAAHLAEIERRKAELPALAARPSQLEASTATAQAEMYQALQSELDAARADLDEARTATKRLEQEARIHEAHLAEAHAAHEQRRAILADCQEQLADAQAQLSAARARQEALRIELADQHERLSAEQEETKAQRRGIARELKARHAAHLTEFERRKAELQALAAARHTQLEAQLAAVNSEMVQAREQLDQMRESLDDRSEELTRTLETANALKSETADLQASLQRTQAEASRGADALKQAEMADEGHHGELIKLRKDCEDLTRQLTVAEDKLKEFSKSERGSEKQENLQRRFEMAVEELREMKTANAQLEAKLAKSRGGSSVSGSDNSTGMDWAAQKQRLLASLEADDDDDEEAVTQRNTIEGTIRITDQIVAQKDCEIAELKRLFEEQTKSPEPTAVSAGAMAQILDHDEIIRHEREKLRQLQAEWREKIGKAEIDVSMERAKIGRDKAELEEKLRTYQRERANHTVEDPKADSQGKPVRGRWLARLGLKELGDS